MKWDKFEKEISFRMFIVDKWKTREIPYTRNQTIRRRDIYPILCTDKIIIRRKYPTLVRGHEEDEKTISTVLYFQEI